LTLLCLFAAEAQTQMIDLSTGKNDDGTIMIDDGSPDADWSYTDPGGTVSTPVVRYAVNGWSSASTNGIAGVSRWITGGNAMTGYHYYKSKLFEIPQGSTNSVLNLRSLSFTRNWTYLVKKNDDGTETETLITQTTYMSDGAKGWLNSRSPEVVNYSLAPGKYVIKVQAFTNSGAQRQAIDVNAFVTYFLTCATPAPFVNTPIRYSQNTAASPLSATGTGLLWYATAIGGTGSPTAPIPSTSNTGTTSYYVNQTVNGCEGPRSKIDVIVNTVDWTLAPNSYIFTGKDKNGNSVDGLYIPVNKAHAMWKNGKHMGGTDLPGGVITADVLWEDNPGLIKSGAKYSLEISQSKESIIVPINKSKEGNAVIAFKIDGEIYWSWHIWVTDDPTKGTTYKSFDALKRERNDGTVELIPDSDWGWMDRNLGALSNTMTGTEWNRNGGLLYQWGRKDPIPPLVHRGNDFYEVSGSIGKIRHRQARNFTNADTYDTKINYVTLSNAKVKDNIRLSVKDPFGIIYVNKDDNSGPAVYPGMNKPPVNWFGNLQNLTPERLSELNLWSDNSQGIIAPSNTHNNEDSAKPYKNKSSYDPCPNGWRIPSNLVANVGNTNYIADVRVDFSPFGIRSNIKNNELGQIQLSSGILQAYPIKPNDFNTPDYFKGFKVYSNTGIDMSGVGGNNMGLFPGVGAIMRDLHGGQFSDQHHIGLWSATMTRFHDATPATGASLLGMMPDIGQPYVMDPSLPSITGLFYYQPHANAETSYTAGCRCIKDPLYIVNSYDFPPDYIPVTLEYKEGIDSTNTYQIVKSSIIKSIKIPVSKAFSVQSEILNNKAILEPANFNDLKANVLWTNNDRLINTVTIENPNPSSLSGLTDSKILVDIKPNQSGNAVITLHNGSITNPIYWSWHVWVTDTPIVSNTYKTELPNSLATNYVNYKKPGEVITTEIMDRDLGANQVLGEANKTVATLGLHFQWGRKDPLPVFINANRNATPVYLGSVQSNGTVTYATLNATTYYSNSYLKKFDDYAAQSNVMPEDKTAEKISKVLSYSVKNPLIFMVPSTLTTAKSNFNHTNGSDWLANEPNLAPDRWGRGGKKSPFDPCPEGWRIPDVTSVANTTVGASPFYKPATSGSSIPANYGGTRINRNPYSSAAIGYVFANQSYNIGNFANSGVRGSRYTIEAIPESPDFNFIDYTYGGFWLGALNSNYTGRALRVDIQHNGDYIFPFSSNADPYFAQSCRCVKITKDGNGEETGPIPKLPVPQDTNKQASNVFETKEIEEKVKDDELIVFPNPIQDIINIDGKEGGEYYYQIYNMAGQMVKEGKFENNQTEVSSLPSGVYLIRINNSDSVVKIVKK